MTEVTEPLCVERKVERSAQSPMAVPSARPMVLRAVPVSLIFHSTADLVGLSGTAWHGSVLVQLSITESFDSQVCFMTLAESTT